MHLICLYFQRVLLSKIGIEIMWDFITELSFKMAFKWNAFRWAGLDFSPSEIQAHPWDICVNYISALWTQEAEIKAACHKTRWALDNFLLLLNFLSQKRDSRIYHPGVKQREAYYVQPVWLIFCDFTYPLPACFFQKTFVRLLVQEDAKSPPARSSATEKLKDIMKMTIIYWT